MQETSRDPHGDGEGLTGRALTPPSHFREAAEWGPAPGSWGEPLAGRGLVLAGGRWQRWRDDGGAVAPLAPGGEVPSYRGDFY